MNIKIAVMKIQKLFLVLTFVIVSQISNAQISFIGFEQDQCGLITSHGYTYENIPDMCYSVYGSLSAGYRIYYDGEMVFERCFGLGSCSVIDMMFISNTTGFIIERNPVSLLVYKTVNSGSDWIAIGSGAPTFLGFYLVNANTGYLITTWDSPLNVYINRVSDINETHFEDSSINQSVVINDTIFGESFCDIDHLQFKIKNANDTIDYTILFISEPLSVQSAIKINEIEISPNPGIDYITIKGLPNNVKAEYKLIDLAGRLKSTGLFYNSPIYIGNLTKGIYLIQLTIDDKIYNGKVVKL